MLLRQTFSLGLTYLICSIGAVHAQTPASIVVKPPSETTDGPREESAAHRPLAPAVGGIETGFRSGVGLGLGGAGYAADGVARSIGDLVAYRIPLWVELMYRLSDFQTLGLYGQFGLGAVGKSCQGECTWAELRAGIQGQMTLSTIGLAVPWIGAGIGYQWLTLRNNNRIDLADYFDLNDLGISPDSMVDTSQNLQRTENLHGPELLLQGGLDFQLSDGLSAGPYLSTTLSSYMSNSRSCEDTRAPEQLPADVACPPVPTTDLSFHVWLTVGLRGTYSP